jgi:uncharacterized protein YjbJ (UPF0337 family)
MGLPTKDEIKGRVNQAKGVVKERVGRAAGDPDAESRGLDDQVRGSVQVGVGQAKRKTSEALNKLANKIRK